MWSVTSLAVNPKGHFMHTDFELSFEYWEGLVQFSLFRHGITEASKETTWETIEPILEKAIRQTEGLDEAVENEDDLLYAWITLVEEIVGIDACRVIVAASPARLVIRIDASIPADRHDLFRIAPWDTAVTELGSDPQLTESRPVLHGTLIAVRDVRIAKVDQIEASTIAGVEPVPASMDYYSEKDDQGATGTTFPVWFGTNRRLYQEDGEVFEIHEEMESERVHFGKCDIWIPKTHRRGEQKSPWYDPRRWKMDDEIRFRNCELLDDLTGSIRDAVDQSEKTNHLLFIHGFNNSFSDAILRAGQIGYDLGIDGATLAFSWPSRKLLPFVSRYSGDGERISGCRKALETMCERLTGLEGTLHVIAHSMGNRALTGAWKNAFETIAKSNSLDVGQVIFAAPDVFQQAFRDDTEGIHEFCKRATLYANKLDHALGLSRILNRTPRAGILPPIMRLENIDTIEVPFNLALFGHTYFAKLIPMLEDLAALIEENSAPGEGGRASLDYANEDKTHWTLK